MQQVLVNDTKKTVLQEWLGDRQVVIWNVCCLRTEHVMMTNVNHHSTDPRTHDHPLLLPSIVYMYISLHFTPTYIGYTFWMKLSFVNNTLTPERVLKRTLKMQRVPLPLSAYWRVNNVSQLILYGNVWHVMGIAPFATLNPPLHLTSLKVIHKM